MSKIKKYIQLFIEMTRHDMILIIRSGGTVEMSAGFLLLLAVLLPFIEDDITALREIIPGFLWIGLLMANMLSGAHIFTTDYHDGTLDLFQTGNVPTEIISIARATAHWVTCALPLSVAAAMLSLIFNLEPKNAFMLLLSMIIASPILSLMTVFGGALVMGLKNGGLLMSLIMIPLQIPVLIFGIRAATPYLNQTEKISAIIVLMCLVMGTLILAPIATAAAIRTQSR